MTRVSPEQAQLEMVAAVAAGANLDRVAELASTYAQGPVLVVVPQLGTQPEQRLAFDYYVSAKLAGDSPAPPSDVVEEVAISLRGKQLGAVLLLADGAPEARSYLHGAAAAALSALAIHEAREDSERRLRGSFLEELRMREDLSRDYIVRSARRLRCDLSEGAVALCAAPAKPTPGHLLATITTEHQGALAETFNERVYALLPGGLDQARDVARRASRQAAVGISSHYRDPQDLRRALEEAELVLEVTASGGSAENGLARDGTYRLLFRVLVSSPDDVRAFYQETIAPVVRYDEEYRSSDLVGTLRCYLDRDCNMNATAQALYAHRHTISYRLERIRELTGLDPFTSEGRESLGLGLKAHHIINPNSATRQRA